MEDAQYEELRGELDATMKVLGMTLRAIRLSRERESELKAEILQFAQSLQAAESRRSKIQAAAMRRVAENLL